MAAHWMAARRGPLGGERGGDGARATHYRKGVCQAGPRAASCLDGCALRILGRRGRRLCAASFIGVSECDTL